MVNAAGARVRGDEAIGKLCHCQLHGDTIRQITRKSKIKTVGERWRDYLEIDCSTAFTTCETVIPVMHRKSMGQVRRKQGEQGAPALSK